MVKVRRFEISVAPDNQGVFSPGELVKGTVIIDLPTPLSIRGIHLSLKGHAQVQWVEGTGENRRTYSDAQEFYNMKLVLYGKGQGHSGGENVTLSKGEHALPFSLRLPTELPSSLELKSCWVRHRLKAVIDLPWSLHPTTTRKLSVISERDLRKDISSRVGCSSSDEKTLCCWCCASGPIMAELTTERSGFVPGEYIFFKGGVINKSTSVLPVVSLALVMRSDLHAHAWCTTKTTHEYYTVVKAKVGSVPSRGALNLDGTYLQVPPLPPSGLHGCRIIDLEYILLLEVKTRSCSNNIQVEMPVTIGTIPLEDSYAVFQECAPPDLQSLLDAEPEASFAPSIPVASPTDVGPISFVSQTAVHQADNDEEEQWAPSYTYYDYGTSPVDPGMLESD